MKKSNVFSKMFLVFALVMIITGMSVNFAATDNESDDVNQLVTTYAKYIKTNNWDGYVNLFNYSQEEKDELLKYLNNKNNQKLREGIFGINNIKVIEIEPSNDPDFINKGQFVYDVYLDMSVNKQSEFYENGLSLHVFVMNYVDGNLSIEAVYYRGIVNSKDAEHVVKANLIPIEPAPYPIPSTIKVYVTSTGVLKTLNFSTYVKDVTPNEVYVTWPTEALKANIIAQKSYAAYNVYYPRTPATTYNAHVTDKWENYQHYSEGSNNSTTNSLYNYTYDVLMVKGQKPYEARYSAGTYGSPGNQGSGYLSQYGTVVLANNGYSYLDILHYYYTDMVVCQYNPYAHVIR